ncbi:MAG TPA: type II toxin-antitoxin system Phd/YefM family antitoxin [Ktedonobacteraceae bacterium]|nr:type II toxin-antitoxin system Phd/YefM family antitoxin [Ktedonobacteraceae bacterium]
MRDYTLSIFQAQEELDSLPTLLEQEPGVVTVTRDEKPVMVIVPYEDYKFLIETFESLQETLEIVQDEELMAAIREGINAMENGETVDWEEAKEIWQDEELMAAFRQGVKEMEEGKGEPLDVVLKELGLE